MCKVKAPRTTPAPVFSTTSLDLWGPVWCRDNVIQKKTRQHTVRKAWGIIFVCLHTGAIYLDLCEDYSTASVLCCIRRFVATRGQPSIFYSDQGSQLKAAAKSAKGDEQDIFPDWKEVAAGLPGVSWEFVPVQAHNFNGISESFIGKTQRALEVTLKPQHLTFGEYLTTLKEIESVLNARPLGELLPDGNPLTVNHLLLGGRSTVDAPHPPAVTETKLTRRFTYLQDLVDQWWKKWYRSTFHHLLPSYKWQKLVKNLETGDVVLVYKEGLGRGTYRYGRVVETFPDKEGVVRRAKVELSGQSKRTVERAQNDLVLLVKHDYENPGVGCEQK